MQTRSFTCSGKFYGCDHREEGHKDAFVHTWNKAGEGHVSFDIIIEGREADCKSKAQMYTAVCELADKCVAPKTLTLIIMYLL